VYGNRCQNQVDRFYLHIQVAMGTLQKDSAFQKVQDEGKGTLSRPSLRFSIETAYLLAAVCLPPRSGGVRMRESDIDSFGLHYVEYKLIILWRKR
jgi:hypothetical protein